MANIPVEILCILYYRLIKPERRASHKLLDELQNVHIYTVAILSQLSLNLFHTVKLSMMTAFTLYLQQPLITYGQVYGCI